jgi:hypothetical protein
MSVQKFLFVAALGALYAAACTPANVGSARTSADVARQFENLETNPDYRYWYLNQENNPFGVVGLDRAYGFDGGPLWRAVEPNSPMFKKVVGLVESFAVPSAKTTGYALFDHQGRPIGAWYSSLTIGITVDTAAKTVSIATSTWRKP